MNNYAVAQSISSTSFNWSGLEYSGSRSQMRTPPPQNSPSSTQRGATQFAVLTGDVTNVFERASPTETVTAAVSTRARNAVAETTTIINEPAHIVPVGVESAPRSDIDRIARERMVLLARKYADQHSAETLARLEKLNGLLLKVAPRVSDDQVVALENSLALLQRTDTARAERARRRAVQAGT